MEEKIKKFFKVVNLILLELEKVIHKLEKLLINLVSLIGWIAILLSQIL